MPFLPQRKKTFSNDVLEHLFEGQEKDFKKFRHSQDQAQALTAVRGPIQQWGDNVISKLLADF